jgi:hypothetical protein
MQAFINKLAQLAGMELEETTTAGTAYQQAQEKAWVRSWSFKARNNRPQRSRTTHVKRRTKR